VIRYPEFVGETAIATLLADALLEMNATAWGNLYERGAYALTAHLLTINNAMGDTRAVVSRSVGDVSTSFASVSSNDSSYLSTKYGREYRRLQRLIGSGGIVV
jgi:hypothetical protein